jgi:hypothetical protein
MLPVLSGATAQAERRGRPVGGSRPWAVINEDHETLASGLTSYLPRPVAANVTFTSLVFYVPSSLSAEAI